MEKFNVTVKVNLKHTIKDIKGQTVEQAVKNFLPVKDFHARVGNVYNLNFEAENKIEAKKIVKTLSEEILANSVIEEYEIIWE